MVENEVELLKILTKINHPNIIQVYDCIETKDKIYIILEYCDENLQEKMINTKFNEEESIDIIY